MLNVLQNQIMKIHQKFQDYIIYSQTYSLKNAPIYIKILSIFYKILGRKLFSKLLVTTKDCNLCSSCVKKCPNQAMELRLKNPRRNNKCKGCLLCVYNCPNQAYVMPLSTIVGTILLLFLPYDKFIRNLLPFQFSSIPILVDMLISLILWSIGYIVIIYLYRKITFLISSIPVVKKMMRNPNFEKIYRSTNPINIFPILVSKNFKPEKQDI